MAPHKRRSLMQNPSAEDKSGEESHPVSASNHESSRSDSESADSPIKTPAASQPAKKKSVAFVEQKSGGGKKQFERVWSEDAELAILKGMAKYVAKNGRLPSSDMDGLYNPVKKLLPGMEFTKLQLYEKVRRLRKKYENRKKKADYKPSKPYDKRAFKLSRKIWEEPNRNDNSLVKPMEKSANEANCSGHAAAMAGESLPLPDYLLKQGLQLVSSKKKAELDAKWTEIHVAEAELCAKRTCLIREQVNLVHEALNSAEA